MKKYKITFTSRFFNTHKEYFINSNNEINACVDLYQIIATISNWPLTESTENILRSFVLIEKLQNYLFTRRGIVVSIVSIEDNNSKRTDIECSQCAGLGDGGDGFKNTNGEYILPTTCETCDGTGWIST